MLGSKEMLINYLQDLQEQGHTHINVEPEAREILMQWYKAGKQHRQTGQIKQQATALAELDKPLFEKSAKKTLAPQTPQLAKATIPLEPPSQQSEIKPLNYLFALQAAQPNLAWIESIYQPSAKLLIITEKPLTKKQHQKLVQILAAMGLELKHVSIASLYKQSQAVINEEYTALSIGLLAQELEKTSHDLILGLGESLLKVLEALNNDYSVVTQMSSTAIDLEGLIAQDDDLSVKRQFWESMLEVMNKLKLPISKKQQGYFK